MNARDLLAAIVLYGVSSLVVYAGYLYSGNPNPPDVSFHFDGGHYLSIAEHGYDYDPGRASNVAFFPGYPLLGRAVAEVSGLSLRAGLFLVSQVALLAAFACFSATLRTRPAVRWPALLALALWPPGICFHVGYSESLLLATLALLMLGFARNWPPIALAVIAGAATGIRAVGVAASVAVLVHILMTADRHRLVKAAAFAPLACWGLLAFMSYQAVQLGEPFAFLHTQRHWAAYEPEHRGPLDKALRLAIAEPIWNSYVPGSARHWSRFNDDDNLLLGSAFWNPILFALAALLMTLGWHRRWLSRDETILGMGLLLIPYATRADEQSMLSHARFAAVVLPMYIVLGELLIRVPLLVRLLSFAVLAAALGLWSALFAANAPLL